jgi:hypothetical protein
MSPEVKLHLVEEEMLRWLADPRADRDRVHADRVSRILSYGTTQSAEAVVS